MYYYIKKQYLNILKHINNNGAIIDPYKKSPLNYQYHYGYFILSSIILYTFEKKKIYIKLAKKIMNYYNKIKLEDKKISMEFNYFAILYGYFILTKEDEIDLNEWSFIYKFILKIKFKNEKELKIFRAIDFKIYYYLNVILYHKIIENKNHEYYCKKIKDLLDEILIDDIFIPDIINKNSKKSSISLVYHFKSLKLFYLFSEITEDHIFRNKIYKIFKKSLNIMSDSGDALFYGRSTNSIYGNCCLVFLLAVFSEFNINYNNIIKTILNKIFIFDSLNGLLNINLSSDQYKRPGFDSYMYVIVYNCYSNAVLLNSIKKLKTNKNNIHHKYEVFQKGFTIYKESKFIKYKNRNISFCINYSNTKNNTLIYNDSRFPIMSFGYLTYNKKDMVAAFPFCKKSPHEKLINNEFLSKFFNFIFQYWDSEYYNNFIKTAYIPFIIYENKYFITNKINILKYTKNYIEFNCSYSNYTKYDFYNFVHDRVFDDKEKKINININSRTKLSVMKNCINITITNDIETYILYPVRFLANNKITFKKNRLIQKNGNIIFVLYCSKDVIIKNKYRGFSSNGKYLTLVLKTKYKVKELNIKFYFNEIKKMDNILKRGEI